MGPGLGAGLRDRFGAASLTAPSLRAVAGRVPLELVGRPWLLGSHDAVLAGPGTVGALARWASRNRRQRGLVAAWVRPEADAHAVDTHAGQGAAHVGMVEVS